MKLSIIVPVYKVEPYLRRCVDSILAQTFTDFELILVDDGSPDGCPAICDEYVRKDSRVKVVHQENAGPSAARNTGLDVAAGTFIGFVDGDDLIHPQMYELLVAMLEQYDADIAQCGFVSFTNEVLNMKTLDADKCISKCVLMERTEFIDHFYPDNRYILHPSVCNKICKKSVYSGNRFPIGRFYEDSYIQIHLLNAAERAVCTREILYYYYQRNGSTMHSKYGIWWAKDINEVCKDKIAFFERKENRQQVQYAIDDYVTRFLKEKFAVYLHHPELRKDFQEIECDINKWFGEIISNPQICRMKKAMFILSYISSRLSYRMARRLFPECIHEFMR